MEYDENYEMGFWNEIFGCVNYLNLPYDTVMNLPIHIRKFWIQKNNQEAAEMREQMDKDKGTVSKSGEMINSYARTEQGISRN